MKLNTVINTISQFIIDPHHRSHSDLVKGLAWMTTLFTGYHTYGAIQGITALWLYSTGSKNETYEKMCDLFSRTFYPQTNPTTPNPSPTEETPYSLEVAMSQVEQARKDGKKIAVFIGRKGNESVPKENGWFWCTLDLTMLGNCTDPTRPHLEIDFNDQEAMKKLWRHFDKVVVDYSVIKFCGAHQSPWPRFIHLLTKNKESELIIEAVSGINPSDRPLEDPFSRKLDLLCGRYSIPWNDRTDLTGTPMNEIREKYMRPYCENITQVFKELFSHVELKTGVYPYHTLPNDMCAPVTYFHLKGPLPLLYPSSLEEVVEDRFEQRVRWYFMEQESKFNGKLRL